MARSRNKYSRAQLRARYRRPRRRGGSTWFYGALTVIVIAGVLGIVFTRNDNSAASAVPPRAGTDPRTGQLYDHWHEALGVEVCGEWLSDPAEFTTRADNAGVHAGLHTHGDGFIHVEPLQADEAGNNATLGTFMRFGGWSVSSDSFSVWTGPSFDPSKKTWTNGDRCPGKDGKPGTGKPGHVVWQVDCENRTGNPSDYKLEDQKVLGIGFVTKGEKLGVPPHAASTPNGEGGNAPFNAPKGCRPSATNNPGGAGTTTTVPASSTSTP
ncbi:MAG TPA: hypothetical protein VFC99_21225 [Acidimicrobiia bacterium]|nr:hypothetical protein [Acidimicrobiia bacterium]